jgi:2-keto-4-pentenoate hydratase
LAAEHEERERNIRERVENRADEVEQLCQANEDPTRPPVRQVQRLAMPIKHMGQELWELTYRYPTVRDLRAVQHLDEVDQHIEIAEIMIGRLTGLTPDAVSQMAQVDLNEAGSLIANFSQRRPSPRPGEQS